MATAIVLAALLALGLGRGAQAATLTVVNNNDSGPGSLRQAVADAAPGDTIGFNPALSGQTITLTTGELLISKNLTITGPAGGMTISGNNASRVFEISVATANLSDLTVANGNSSGNGGGIQVSSGTLNATHSTISTNSARTDGGGIWNAGAATLTNVTVSGNSAARGGGILSGGPLTLTNSTISGNSSFNGGGIWSTGSVTLTYATVSGNTTTGGDGGGIWSTAAVTLTYTTVSGNTTAGDGGGIFDDGTLTLTNSTVNGNSAHSGGGGVYNGGAATLTKSTVSGNNASAGGGIQNNGAILNTITSTISGNTGGLGGGIWNGGALILTNSTLSGNTAIRYGGGIFNLAGVTLTNSTISGNGALVGGGGISSMSGGGEYLTNSIVANQASGGDCQGGVMISLGYNLDSDGSCNLTAMGDLPSTNPLLAPLALNSPGVTQTHALQTGSPAIDRIPFGVNGCGTTITRDQRGVIRPQGAECDIGAYEVSEHKNCHNDDGRSGSSNSRDCKSDVSDDKRGNHRNEGVENSHACRSESPMPATGPVPIVPLACRNDE